MPATSSWVILVANLETCRLRCPAPTNVHLQQAHFFVGTAPFQRVALYLPEGTDAVADLEGQQAGTEDGTDLFAYILATQAATGTRLDTS